MSTVASITRAFLVLVVGLLLWWIALRLPINFRYILPLYHSDAWNALRRGVLLVREMLGAHGIEENDTLLAELLLFVCLLLAFLIVRAGRKVLGRVRS